jgi:GNAT superfamily N-acetyltransferase
MQEEILPITRQSYLQAAQVLAKAFVDDPVSVASFNGFTPDRRVRALTVDFSNELQVCIRRAYPIQLNEANQAVAVAVIYPPGAYPLPFIEGWLIQLKSILGNGLYDIRPWLKWLNQVEKHHPTEAHFYLEYLAVEPEYQGKGYGSAILKHLTGKADELGVGCYLENANPRNVAFYQRAGFLVTREMEIIGIHTWLMWRPAKQKIVTAIADGSV